MAGSRGGHTVEVDRALQVPANTMASIVWYRESGDDSLLEHVLGTMEGVTIGGRYTNPDPDRLANPFVTQPVTIQAVDGNTVTLKEPLLHNLKSAWRPRLVAADDGHQVGFEHFRVVFPEQKYGGHHLEAGFNAFDISRLRHGWLRDVTVVMPIPNFTSRLSYSTITDFAPRKGHYGIHLGSLPWCFGQRLRTVGRGGAFGQR